MKFRILRTPSFDLAISLATGIFIARFSESVLSGLFILSLLSATLYLLSRIPKRFRLFPVIFSIIGFFLITNGEDRLAEPNHISAYAGSKKVEITGTAQTGFRYFGADGYRFNMEANQIKGEGFDSAVNGLILVSVYEGENPPLPGDEVTLKEVNLKPLFSFGNIGGFDYARFMKDSGVLVRAGISNESKIVISRSEKIVNPYRFGEELRRSIHQWIESRFSEKLAPIASAMTLGITDGVSEDTRRNFAVSGLAHLLAISGLHVGFITGFAYFFLYGFFFLLFARYKPELGMAGFPRKPAVILSLLAGLIFVLSTGSKVSAVRAGIMVGIYLLSAMAGREKDPMNALAVSALLILLFDPTAIFSASFQMSYIAVASIIVLFADDGEEPDELENLKEEGWLKKGGEFFWGTIKISFAVGIALAPVVLHHFGEVHLGGFLANLFAVPLAAVAVPATLIGGVINPLSSTLGSVCGWAGTVAFGGISLIADTFSSISIFSISGPPLPLLLTLLFYPVYLSWFLKKGVAPILRFSLTLIIAMLVFIHLVDGERTATEVRFLDVGQGDSALILLKTGENILIDGGTKFGRLDAGTLSIIPALHRLRVRELDGLIATHGDMDHTGGLESIMKRIPVKRYFDNDQPDNNRSLIELRVLAREKSIPAITLREGDEVEGSNGTLKVLHPDEHFIRDKKYRNNDFSLALMLETEGVRFLFTGDMEKDAEKYLLEKNVDLRADVLKVAHHGSRTSSTAPFLNAVNPTFAIISSGRMNRFRYPSKEVIRRFEKMGTRVLNTSETGEILFRLNGPPLTPITARVVD